MINRVFSVCLCMALTFMGVSQSWSLDMEDHFLDPEFSSSKVIFIDVRDVSLINVLKIISKQSGLSFVANHDVADMKITLYLNKIPLDQALHMILDSNGLSYEMENDSNVFVVKKKEITEDTLITKVFQLKYATVSVSPLNSTISISSTSSSSPSSSSTASTSASQPAPPSSPGSASSSSGGTVTTGGLEDVLKNALSGSGRVVEDARTNSLIITDKPSQFPMIESTIAKLDVPIPQILIEVEMIDVSKSVADQLGITYGATPLTFTGGSQIENFPFGSGIKPLAEGGSSSSSSSSTTPPTTGWNANGLVATLNFLTTLTDTRTLARPRILTLNNQTAEIQISRDQALDVVPSSTSSGTAGSTESYTVDRYTTGIILKVTPQANLVTREITMAVSPRDIDLIQSKLVPPTGGFIYDPETRGSDSLLKLKDGQSMVIGGLVNTELDKTIVKLPFFGDLPLVGAAFRSKNTTKTERELLIFLTPHIIDDPNQLAFRGVSHQVSADEKSDTQDVSERGQEINDTLNSYEMKNN